MPGLCVACTFLSDCILNVLNNVAVICGGDESVVLGSSIVSQGLSLVLEWSVITCAAVSEVTTSFTQSSSRTPSVRDTQFTVLLYFRH